MEPGLGSGSAGALIWGPPWSRLGRGQQGRKLRAHGVATAATVATGENLLRRLSYQASLLQGAALLLSRGPHLPPCDFRLLRSGSPEQWGARVQQHLWATRPLFACKSHGHGRSARAYSPGPQRLGSVQGPHCAFRAGRLVVPLSLGLDGGTLVTSPKA